MNVGLGEAFPGRSNKAFNKTIVLFASHPMLSKTQIQVILEQPFILITKLA